jgi:hypothetical protein
VSETSETDASTVFTFDWQAEPEGFKKWLVPTLLGDVIRDDDLRELMRRRSGNWRKVELDVRVNGVPVDGERFLARLEHAIHDSAERAAARRVDEVRDLTRLRDVVEEVADQLRSAVETIAYQNGIELRDRD